ncbi:MAG: hypothetical protein JWM68_206 [Verrucomicrobiales bacterium]|nr:hypothetical protein [Verrucomicrobiales bacterium]
MLARREGDLGQGRTSLNLLISTLERAENNVSCDSSRKDLPCGGLELNLCASSFIDLLKLMRGFGNDVVPLSPPALVQEWHTVADLMSADGKAVAAGKFQFDPPRKKEPEAKV